MANLVSPGIQVNVTDESFFTSSGPGTVPLVFVATNENKPTPGGESVAPGTLKQNANKLFLISSQRELLQTFGNPNFRSIGGSAQHGNPLNEYGLLAAHSFLGVSNRAYVVRADVPLDQLEPSVTPPSGDPVDLTYWADLNNISGGLFVSTGTGTGNWEPVSVTVFEGSVSGGDTQPASGFVEGDHILAAGSDASFKFLVRESGEWNAIDEFFVSSHTSVPTASASGQYWFKTTSPNQGASIDVKVFDSEIGSFVSVGDVQIVGGSDEYYNTFSTNVSAGTVAAFAEQVLELSTEVGYNLVGTNGTFVGGSGYSVDDVITLRNGAVVEVNAVDGNGAVTEFEVVSAGNSFTGTTVSQDTVVDSGGNPASGTGFSLVPGINNTTPVSLQYELYWHNGESQTTVISDAFDVVVSGDLTINGVDVSLATTDSVSDAVAKINNASIPNIVAFEQGDAIRLVNTTGRDIVISKDGTLSGSGFEAGIYSNFILISEAAPAYFASFEQPTGDTATGTLWYDSGFRVDILENDGTGNWVDFSGTVFVQSAEPTANDVGDLWVNTSLVDEYPVIRRWDSNEWVLVDNTDQTTPSGIIFADARSMPSSSLDDDAPDAFAFPSGMLLWNTRYSSRNVKEWDGDKWVSVSGTNPDGSLITGQAAVRAVIVSGLQSSILDNEEIRSETLFTNILAAPGFPEVAGSLVSLNIDRRETAFVIADTPFDLAPTSNSIQSYAQDEAASSENVAYYYPSALATNLDGTEVVVPASHMALRVYATNDQVSYPWFAPAGFQRGVVTNVRRVGYLNQNSEFVELILSQGKRDVLYTNNINPIVDFPGRGIIILGQKTRSPVESALDRVNVARLINFIRFQAERISEPFLFQPNDTQTRNSVADRFESFLAELVTLRGVFDFLVVCDETNNTPARIDRNELYVDLAISPTKSVEFIFIPVRVRNTGADLSL